MVFSATRAQTPPPPAPKPSAPAAKSAYDFTLTRIDGKPLPLSAYKGQVVLLVNTASFCGFTPQYEGLQKLQQAYQAKGFTVLGVPSGDFMSQEYDDNGKIKQFCDTKFGITFPMAEKAHVKGDQAIPLYRWAKTQIPVENEPKWNFHKFLIGKDGKIIAGFNSKVTPESPELTAAINKALKA
ncbi:glutathione peroxidase [Sandaracinobacter neustonicus]|uniref:Glutathione peroxidase n=2 Tax=Sandaracinobacter neustonicus TaxID=1715348 RepID=A0A501XFC1_9SPHN|nr:glutathione peroxidase [Sandaracinobacter neustonicus]